MNGCKGWEEIEVFVEIRRMKTNKTGIQTKMVLWCLGKWVRKKLYQASNHG